MLLVGGCEKATDTSPDAWNVTIEQIDLSKPVNKKYIDWYEAKEAEPDEKTDPWDYVWEDKDKKLLREKYQTWNDEIELVVQYTPALATNATGDDETLYDIEFLTRSISTKETQLIAEGYWSYFDWATGTIYDVVEILSDTHILYEKNDYCADCGDSLSYYLYDWETGESSYVAGDGLHYLDDMQYLFIERDEENKDCVYLSNLRKLIAGEEDAKRQVCQLPEYGYIEHFSQDMRFVYLLLLDSEYNLHSHRVIYSIETGKQVADFQLPVHYHNSSNHYTVDGHFSALINDVLEYRYDLHYVDGLNGEKYLKLLYVIHYER